MTRRTGATSIPELLLVCTLFALVLTAIAGFVAAQADLAAAQRDRVRSLEAFRTAAVVLAGELRALAPADVLAWAPDSIRIRAIRGTGVVCGRSGNDVVVRYRGVRLPDPAKDSVILIRSGAPESTYAVVGVAGDTGCADGLRVSLDRPADPSGMALVYEVGTYHLAGPSLRYRRGAGGRQPMTESVLDRAWLEPAASGLRLRLALDLDSLPHLPGTGRRAILLHMLNGGAP